MNLEADETILRKERLHAGIFAVPALMWLLMMLPVVLYLWFASQMLSVLSSVGGPVGAPPVPRAAFAVPLLIASVPAAMAFVVVGLAYLESEIVLTSKRLMFRAGILMRVTGEVPLENVEAIYLVEPFLGRFFGYGTITLTTIGAAQFPLRFIGEPQVFHAVVQKAVTAAKSPPPRKSRKQAVVDDSRYMPKGVTGR